MATTVEAGVRAQHTSPEPPGRVRKRRLRGSIAPWYFVIPGVVIFAFVILVPAARGAIFSFTDWNGLSPTWSFVGLNNYVRLFNDPAGRDALVRTVMYAVLITIGQTAVGLCLALALNKIRFAGAYRMLFFAPVVIMPVVAAFLWKYMLGTDGPVNQVLNAVGLGALAQPWLGQPTSAFWSIVVIVIWQLSGISMAIFLAGLQSIPDELLEAAELDGASRWTRFRYVTWPLLRPALTVNTLLIMITGLKLFDQVWVVTQGGPGSSTDTATTALYRTAFALGDFSYGLTMAIGLTVVVAVIAILQLILTARSSK